MALSIAAHDDNWYRERVLWEHIHSSTKTSIDEGKPNFGLLLWHAKCPQETIPARREQSLPKPLRERHRWGRVDSNLD